jgi:hypothetical protein
MVPQYDKTQYRLFVFSAPLLNFFQNNEEEYRENCGAASETGLACNFPTILPNQESLNILVSLLCAVR